MKQISFTVQFFAALSLSFFGSINAFASPFKIPDDPKPTKEIITYPLIIEVPDDPKPTRETVIYQCDMGTSKEYVEATYHNAGNISLVDLKWKGKRIVGSNVISASGAKYVGGPYIWWTKRNEATFYDLINDPKEEKPISCIEEKSAQ